MNEQIFEAFAIRIQNGYSYEKIEEQFLAAGYTADQVRDFYSQTKARLASESGAVESAPEAAFEPQTQAKSTTTAVSMSVEASASQPVTEWAPEAGMNKTVVGTPFVLGLVAILVAGSGVAGYFFLQGVPAEEMSQGIDVPTEEIATKPVVEEKEPPAIVRPQGDFILTLSEDSDDGVVRRGESFGYVLSMDEARTYFYDNTDNGYFMRSDVIAEAQLVSATDPDMTYTFNKGTPLKALSIGLFPYVSEEDLCTVRDTAIQSFIELMGGRMSIEEAVEQICAGDGSGREDLPNIPDGEYYVVLKFYDANGTLTATGVSPRFAAGDTVEPVLRPTAAATTEM